MLKIKIKFILVFADLATILNIGFACTALKRIQEYSKNNSLTNSNVIK